MDDVLWSHVSQPFELSKWKKDMIIMAMFTLHWHVEVAVVKRGSVSLL